MTTAATHQTGNGQPPVPALIQVPTKGSGAGSGDVLSPSQANCFLECPAKWYFKYLRELPEPKNGCLALGIAVDEALCYNFRQKIETHQDRPAEEVLDAFSSAWSDAAMDVEFRDDEDVHDLQSLGAALVQKYMLEGAPLVQPRAVQLAVEGLIAELRSEASLTLWMRTASSSI